MNPYNLDPQIGDVPELEDDFELRRDTEEYDDYLGYISHDEPTGH